MDRCRAPGSYLSFGSTPPVVANEGLYGSATKHLSQSWWRLTCWVQEAKSCSVCYGNPIFDAFAVPFLVVEMTQHVYIYICIYIVATAELEQITNILEDISRPFDSDSNDVCFL